MNRARQALIRRRLAQLVPVLLITTFFAFVLLRLGPTDPAVLLAGESPTQAHIEEVRRAFGLDRPLLLQYASWLWRALHGDLSRSLLSGDPVATTILATFPPTLLIVGLALAVSSVLGSCLGAWAAVTEGSVIDSAITTLTSVGIAMPYFWVAMLLVSVFSLWLGLFPPTGAVPLSTHPIAALHSAVLPAAALAAGGVAEVTRQCRAALVDVLRAPHIRTLHAKGLGMGAIVWRHGFKDIGITLLTVVGLVFNRLLGATVVVEAVFAIPGVGSAVVNAAINSDFVVVQGVVLVMAVIVVLVNLLIDVLCTMLDPRIAGR